MAEELVLEPSAFSITLEVFFYVAATQKILPISNDSFLHPIRFEPLEEGLARAYTYRR